MNISVVQISISILVRFVSKPAAPFAKVAETKMPVMIIRTAMNFWTLPPKYFEMMLGIVNPSFRTDMNPEKKS